MQSVTDVLSSHRQALALRKKHEQTPCLQLLVAWWERQTSAREALAGSMLETCVGPTESLRWEELLHLPGVEVGTVKSCLEKWMLEVHLGRGEGVLQAGGEGKTPRESPGRREAPLSA